MTPPDRTRRRTVHPRWKALGREPRPQAIDLNDEQFTLNRIFKNDFFAVTALYASAERQVVLKTHRTATFFLLPLRWLGRLSAAREAAALTRAAGIEGVPALLGRWCDTGLIREFIPGHPLQKGERVPDDFHARLAATIRAIHDRNMAYVDLEKCENVIVGNDGRPYLIDFQIAWHWSKRWGGDLPPMRILRRWFQTGDRYHLLKLQRRTRPDQLTPEQLAASYRKPWYLRLHRAITYPFLRLRRKVLRRVDPDHRGGERGLVVPSDTWPP